MSKSPRQKPDFTLYDEMMENLRLAKKREKEERRAYRKKHPWYKNCRYWIFIPILITVVLCYLGTPYTTYSNDAFEPAYCKQEIMNHKIQDSISDPELKTTYIQLREIKNRGTFLNFPYFAMPSDLKALIAKWEIEYDNLKYGRLFTYKKHSTQSPTSNESLYVSVYKSNSGRFLDFDISVYIHDENFKERNINPSSYTLTGRGLKAAVKSLAEQHDAKELIELFTKGGFKIEEKQIQDQKLPENPDKIVKITIDYNPCKLTDRIIWLEGMSGVLAGIYLDENGTIIKTF